ncbi:MAG: hypothetical protein EOO92_08640 [Pedobacter sp.]|nr:MAG: hypothetical protein EOO92_08640 [Pedobacter sp.]
MKKIVFSLLLIFSMLFSPFKDANAQCAMCTINAEQGVKNGNTQAKGINSGVLYLLAIPYAAIIGLGVLWYTKYRKKPAVYAENV